MPISDELKSNNKIDFKQKYINLKRKLKLLIYENESYSEELKKAERQLLQVSRDKSYLLDRLLQYERIESSTSDSEETLSSDSESESRKLEAKKKKTNETNELQNSSNTSRKKKTNNTTTATRSRSSSTGKLAKMTTSTQISSTSTSMTASTMTIPLIKSELSLSLSQSLASCSQSSKASVSSTSSVNSTIDGHMTSEELERHLESRRQPSALLMPEKTPLTVPVELFSNESSNGLPEDDSHIHLKLMP